MIEHQLLRPLLFRPAIKPERSADTDQGREQCPEESKEQIDTATDQQDEKENDDGHRSRHEAVQGAVPVLFHIEEPFSSDHLERSAKTDLNSYKTPL